MKTTVFVSVCVDIEHNEEMPLDDIKSIADNAVDVRMLFGYDKYGVYTTEENEEARVIEVIEYLVKNKKCLQKK